MSYESIPISSYTHHIQRIQYIRDPLARFSCYKTNFEIGRKLIHVVKNHCV